MWLKAWQATRKSIVSYNLSVETGTHMLDVAMPKLETNRVGWNLSKNFHKKNFDVNKSMSLKVWEWEQENLKYFYSQYWQKWNVREWGKNAVNADIKSQEKM